MMCAEAEWKSHLIPLCIDQGARYISHNTAKALTEAFKVLPNLLAYELVLSSCHSPRGVLQHFKLLRAAQQSGHVRRRPLVPASYLMIRQLPRRPAVLRLTLR